MHTLLVALDGSSFADAALPVAVGLARRLKASIDLVSVLDSDPRRYATGGAPLADRRLERERETEWRDVVHRHLDGVRTRITALADAPPVRTTVLAGPVAETLVAHARDTAAAMLIVTTHGRGGLSRAWLGSVADTLVRTAPVPIVAVHPEEQTRSPDSLAAWHLRRVLVPLDGSFAGEQVLSPLRPLLASDVECVIMRAISPLHPMLRTVATGSEFERDLAEQRTMVTSYLRRMEEWLRHEGVWCSHCAHEEFDPPRAIRECADLLDVDLIALATRGRGEVGRLLVGSVADKVLRTTNRPVLLHRVEEGEPAS